MKILLRFASLASLVLLGSGCTFNSEQVSFNHGLAAPMSAVGDGKSVTLTVKDERDDQTLGHRGNGAITGAAITTGDNMVTVVHDKFEKGLAGLSVKLASGADTSGALTVELRLLSYGTSTGFFTGGIETKGTIKVIGTINGKSFEKLYHAEAEERVVVVPTADHNSELLNAILDATLLKAFNDEEFRAFLKG